MTKNLIHTIEQYLLIEWKKKSLIMALSLSVICSFYIALFIQPIANNDYPRLMELIAEYKAGNPDWGKANHIAGGHWYLIGNLILVPWTAISNWNTRWDAILNIIAVNAIFLVWATYTWPYIRSSISHPRLRLFALPMGALILFSLSQATNLVCGYQISVFLYTLGVLLAATNAVHITEKRIAFVGMCIGVLLACYSMLPGLALLPAISLLFWVRRKEIGNIYITLWALFATLVLAHNIYILLEWKVSDLGVMITKHYSKSYEKISENNLGEKILLIASTIETIIVFIFNYIGSPISRFAIKLSAPLWGLFGLFIFSCFTLYSIKNKDLSTHQRNLIWTGIILVITALSAAILTVIGRYEYGAWQAFNSRYTTLCLMFWLGIWTMYLAIQNLALIPVLEKKKRAVWIVLLALLTSHGISSAALAWKEGRRSMKFTQIKKEIQASWPNISDESLDLLYPGNATTIRRMLITSEKAGLSPFPNLPAENR